jgi:hypothetical protein
VQVPQLGRHWDLGGRVGHPGGQVDDLQHERGPSGPLHHELRSWRCLAVPLGGVDLRLELAALRVAIWLDRQFTASGNDSGDELLRR